MKKNLMLLTLVALASLILTACAVPHTGTPTGPDPAPGGDPRTADAGPGGNIGATNRGAAN